MARSELLRHIPDAPGALINILDAGRGPVQSPIRSEIFGSTRFAQHGHSLADTHRVTRTAEARRGSHSAKAQAGKAASSSKKKRVQGRRA